MVRKASLTSRGGKNSAGKKVSKNKAPQPEVDIKHQLKIQKALYEVADAASAGMDMQSFYKRLHEIVGSLMYAENFFIALHDPQTDLITWPYYVDTVDVEQPEPITLKEQHGGTGWILRTGRTLSHAEGTVSYAIEHGEAEQTGTVSDAIGVPLKSEGKTAGVLLIQSYRDDIKYNSKHVEIMNFVAQHISIALTRARAIEETRRRNSELQIINSVQEGLASKLDMQGIYELIGRKVLDIFHVQVMDIVNYDPETNLISMPYSYEKGDRSVIEPREPYGFRLQVIESCQPLLINKDFKELALRYDNPLLTGTWPKSALFVPLVVEGRVRSIISIQDLDREEAYSASDVLLLQTLSHSMGIALENARLFTETQRLLKETEDRNAELAIINSVQEALAAQLDMHGIYEAVGEKLREIFSYQDVTIYTADLRSRIVTVEYSYELGEKSERRSVPMNSLYEYFMTSNRTFVFNGDLPALAAKFSDYQNPEPPKSLLAVPVRRNKDTEPVVYLTIQDWSGKKFFSDSDVRLMETLANSMSVALENARLFDEVQKRNQEITEALEQQTATSEILSVIASSPTDVQPVFDAIVERAAVLCKGAMGVAYQVMNDQISVAAAYLPPNQQALQEVSSQFPTPLNVPDSESNIASVIRNQSILHVMDMKTDPRLTDWNREIAIKYGVGATLWMPLVKDKKGIGAIFIGKYKTEPFTEEQVALVKTFADQAVIAIENVRLFNELQKRNQEITEALEQQTATSEILGVIASSPTQLQPVLDVIAERAAKICDTGACQIRLIEGDHLVVASNYGDDRQFSVGSEVAISRQTVSGRAVIDREMIHIPDLLEALDEYPLIANRVRQTGNEAWLVAPLLREGVAMGTIHIRSFQIRPFTEKQISQLKIFADQAVIAIENVRLFHELQKRNQEITEALEQQTATSEILSVIASSPTDVQPVFDAIVESAVKLCGGFAGFGYRVLDGKIHLVAQYNDLNHYQELQPDFPLPLDTPESESNIVSVIRTCTMLHIEDQKTDPRIIPDNQDYAVRVGVGSSIWIPLVKDAKGIGAIVTGKHQVEPFTESQIALIKTFADQAVIAIENVRLFTETQRLLKETEDRNAELAIINSVQEGLASKLDMQSIYDLVGNKIMEIFNADVVGIGFYDRSLKALNHPYVVDHGERYSPPPMAVPDEMVDYLKTHDATLINTYQEAQALMERFGIHNIGGPTPDNSYIVVPLMIGGEFMGRITVAKLPAYAFTESDVRLLQTLVNSMSVALENARLWEQEKLYRKALERELEIGREIQAGFLPETLPCVEGWEIAASLMSAREVAGDFYDAFELPDGNIGLVIADVCDKGVGAALFMTLFRSLIRAASNLDYFEHTEKSDAPHSAKERLQRAISLTNNYIADTHGESGMFATLFFGILDPRDGKFTYINCGHESPFIMHAGAVLEPLRVTGPAVGVLANACFDILETQFHTGETFFAYTDGVPDCQDPRGEFFGRERLLDVFQRVSDSSLDLVKTVESELREYISNATQFDDITLLAVRRG